MKAKGRQLDNIKINYITFESGDNEALIDYTIDKADNGRKSKLIISMSDLNKLISTIKKIIKSDLDIECHKLNSESSFYQIDLKKAGLSKLDLSSFFFSGGIRQIIA